MSGTTGSPPSPAAQVVQAADFASPVAVGKAVTRRDVETLWTTKPSIIYSTKEKTWLVARSVANKSGVVGGRIRESGGTSGGKGVSALPVRTNITTWRVVLYNSKASTSERGVAIRIQRSKYIRIQ